MILDTIRLLAEIVDIYMPDMKYGESLPPGIFSGSGLPEVNFAAVKEMHRQVGIWYWINRLPAADYWCATWFYLGD